MVIGKYRAGRIFSEILGQCYHILANGGTRRIIGIIPGLYINRSYSLRQCRPVCTGNKPVCSEPGSRTGCQVACTNRGGTITGNCSITTPSVIAKIIKTRGHIAGIDIHLGACIVIAGIIKVVGEYRGCHIFTQVLPEGSRILGNA